jgi:hypothetical protein
MNAPTTIVYELEPIALFCAARDTGAVVEITRELFDYFLDVLPPVRMHYSAPILDANGVPGRVSADFGFAEGAETITAFWHGFGPLKGRFFAQRTTQMNPYA